MKHYTQFVSLKQVTTLLKISIWSIVLFVSANFTPLFGQSFNPNPDCDIQAIRDAALAKGLIELDNCNNDCSMFFLTPTATNPFNATGANSIANSLGATVATISSQELNDCLIDQLIALGITGNIYIGLNRHQDFDDFTWRDGNTENTYTNWATGMPNMAGGTPSWAYINLSNGEWYNSHVFAGKRGIIRVDLCPEMKVNDYAICEGKSRKIRVIPRWGSKPYTYQWNNGPTIDNQIVSPATTTSYSVLLTDRYGCTADSSLTVRVIPVIEFDTDIIQATCGENDGEIHINITNFTPGEEDEIQYSIDDGITYHETPDFTNLPPGVYKIRVQLEDCAPAKATVSVGVIGAPSANFTFSSICSGSSATPTDIESPGGTFSFDPIPTDGATINPTTGEISNGVQGTTYTVQYAVGPINCQNTHIEEVGFFNNPTPNISITHTSCNQDNGKLIITASNGKPAYSFSSDNGATFQSNGTFNDLTAGDYDIVIKDDNGCEGTAQATINVITPPTIELVSQDNVSCNGGNNGAITVQVNDGTPNYSYAWSPSGGNNATATNLTADTYTLTITDADGCTAEEEFIITEPDPLTIDNTIDVTDATCGEDNGSASVSVTGGTGNYTYSWSPNGGTAATAPDLAPGDYTVTVTDENGCSATSVSTTVGNIAPPTISLDAQTDVTFFGGNDGSATVSTTGGTPTYTYSWSPSGGNDATSTGLSAGTYTVTVTDDNGCTDEITVTILEPDDFEIEVTGTDSHCDLENGTATVSITSGDPDLNNYTFNWSPSGQTTLTATTLTPGTYTVTVTHISGNEKEEEITIGLIEGPSITIDNQENPACNAGNDGSVEISITNGTAPYTILWSSGGNAVTETDLAAGTYTVTVTDDAGCTTQEEIILTEPDAIVLTTTSTDATCGEDNGSAEVDATGGAGNYTFVWSPNGGTDALATDLAADTYTVTVTDENGCSEEATVTINAITPPSIAIDDIENVNCFAGTDGTATVSAIGGTGNYTFTWPSGNTSATETDLAAGTYNVIVTDEDGCTDAIDVVITEPDALTATLVGTDSNCDLDNGSTTVSPTGGIGLYTFAWSSGGTTDTETNLSPGEYSVTITDENGCSIEEEVTIDVIPSPAITLEEQNDISCNGLTDGSIEISISNGTAPYTILWSSGGNAVTETDLAAGTYTVTVTDDAGCTTQEEIILTAPDAIVLTTTSTDATCGEDNGSAEVDATGGAGNYTFVWSPSGGTDALATDLAADTYTVTVTDENGCSEEATVTIDAITPPSIAIDDIENVNCFAGTNGTATVSAIGGTGNYTFTWPSGNTSATETDLAAGTYNVIVTDEDGCTDAIDVVITEPTEITYNITTTETPCNADAGTATVTVNGGSPTYTFLWSNGATTATATGLSAGEHTLTITDNAGCQITASVTITQINPPIVNIQDLQNISCNDANDGSITVDVVNGTGPFTYTWSPAVSTSNSATDLAAGTYTITVTDDNGCTDEITANITNPSAIVVTGIIEDASCGQTDGSIELNVSGGTAPYNFNWTPNLGNTDFVANLEAGDYSVLVSDGMGCTATATFTIDKLGTFFLEADPSVVEIPLGDAVDIELDIDNNIVVDEITWTPATGLSCTDCPNPTASPEETTTYYVEVTSADGCVAYDTVVVIVDIPCGEFYVPNVFSPNGDGQNDVFCALSNCMVALKMEIYNRWGERVFSTTNPKECWDGTSNGEAVQAGVYAYTLEAVMKDGEVIKQSGNVTVVR